MQIDLTESDLHLLQQVLRNERRALLNEIAHTDSRDFREELRQRHERLEAIARAVDRARGAGEVAPPQARW